MSSTVNHWENWVCELETLVERAGKLGVRPNFHHLDRFRAELQRDIEDATDEHDDPYIDTSHAILVEQHMKSRGTGVA